MVAVDSGCLKSFFDDGSLTKAAPLVRFTSRKQSSSDAVSSVGDFFVSTPWCCDVL
jgi:hypothetical protein